MTTIVTRAGKGSALSWVEADANLTNLNNDKLEASALAPYATTASVTAGLSTKVNTSDIGTTVQAYSANLTEYATVNPTTAGLALLDDVDSAAQRSTLGLGTAAVLDVGTSANQIVQLDGTGALPAVSAENLTNLPLTQIQPISASVAGNELTISASELELDFRSTTLGSGAVTRVSGTPANLVISSGSTLGTLNNVQSNIAVLALNNAGTIELAAVNIAGGVNLDETGVISTTAEGGAGGADSATVVYSTTARTNVAYRVIGLISSTQATAGTWATAPSKIQGAGGNAVQGLMTLGHGQTWQSVTRTSGTTYYNTTGKPILVLYTAVFTSASIVVGGQGIAAPVTTQAMTVSFIVPPGMSYVITNSGAVIGTVELR